MGSHPTTRRGFRLTDLGVGCTRSFRRLSLQALLGFSDIGGACDRAPMTDLNDPAALMCHYTRAETAFSTILPNGTLLMNPYSKMRDPHENQIPFFRSAAGWGDDESQEKLFWDLQRQVSLSRSLYTLLALTQGDPDDDGDPVKKPFRCPWSRPRMWEQYAENHFGACLIFDREKLITALRHNLGNDGSFWDGPVEYTTAGYAASDGGTVTLDGFHEGALEDEVAIHVQKHYKDFYFLKTTDWETEFEYRFVFKRADDKYQYGRGGNYVNYGDALQWVVVGEKFPDWQLPGAEAVARQANVELRRMSWKLNRPWPGKPKKMRRVVRKAEPAK